MLAIGRRCSRFGLTRSGVGLRTIQFHNRLQRSAGLAFHGRHVFSRIWQWIFRGAAVAFEEGADFNRQSFVQKIALDAAGGMQVSLASANIPLDATADDRFLGIDVTDDDCRFANDEPIGADIALESPVELNVACRKKRSFDDKVRTDD